MKIFNLFLSVLAIMLLMSGCSKGGPECKKRADSGALIPGCEDNHRPIIFVHGFLGAGDNYANMVQLFIQNGYCPEKLILFDWDTQSVDVAQAVDDLSVLIDSVIEKSGFPQVDLIGHSMGGLVSNNYLNMAGSVEKIAHYIHAASFADANFPPSLKVMTLSSHDDTILGYTEIPGAINVEVSGADHIQVVTSSFSFMKAYEFFNDGLQPQSVEIIPVENPALEGKAITIGENMPLENAEVRIYSVNPETGERLSSDPVACFITDDSGRWGVFNAKKDEYYEIYLKTKDNEQLHYYRQPFLGTQHAVYLRSLGSGAGMVGQVLSSIAVYSDEYSVMVLFSSNQAVYHGRDTASIDGFSLSTPDIADPKQASLAFFFGDENQNRISDFTRGALSNLPFLEDIDYFIPTETRKPVIFEFKNSRLAVPNWRSESEGIGIAVFDY